MINKTEKQERQYLENVTMKLRAALEKLDDDVQRRAKDIREQKAYLWENKTGMDHAEKISVRQGVDMSVLTAETVLARKKRIQKLLATPYFGRFDFVGKDEADPLPVYIGIHAFSDDTDHASLIYDWRAPISTMFYDYETGKAQYESPGGTVAGEIVLKRQYRIRKGKMEFMLESDVSIHDDVLQKELSSASDDKMKNIVATIQRDQNAIIRNEDSHVLIIQGVAGSGKTSIALHRIAFLLYRFKETISSNDILIISPNKVFADYISNVLPELGEEKMPEIGIEELAKELLERQYKFQTFFEQVARLLEDPDEAFSERIRAKATFEFFHKLNDYVAYIEKSHFAPAEIKVGPLTIPPTLVKKRFDLYPTMPLFRRLDKVAKDIESHLRIYRRTSLSSGERSKLKTAVKRMFKLTTLRAVYKDFYAWLGHPEWFKPEKGAVLEYSDVFPFIYLKMCLEGGKVYDHVKHLLVDEMQDYTPVQYAVISRLFACKKTILGDANQSVNPFSSSSSSEIQKVFAGADCVKLCKSYRSTYEITKFAQRISPNADLEAIERRGEEPDVRGFKSRDNEIREIKRIIKAFPDSGYHSLGIICKTEKQATQLYEAVQGKEAKVYLLTSQSVSFARGLVMCSSHMAKGLEFDQVIVPEVTEKNYATVIDKSMLYVACTRAMHRLTVTYVNKKSSFLPNR